VRAAILHGFLPHGNSTNFHRSSFVIESTYNTVLQCSTCGRVSVFSFDGDNYGATAARCVEFHTEMDRKRTHRL